MKCNVLAYSATIFTKRLDEVLDNVYKLYTLHGTFENIYVVNLGDCIDGFNNPYFGSNSVNHFVFYFL